MAFARPAVARPPQADDRFTFAGAGRESSSPRPPARRPTFTRGSLQHLSHDNPGNTMPSSFDLNAARGTASRMGVPPKPRPVHVPAPTAAVHRPPPPVHQSGRPPRPSLPNVFQGAANRARRKPAQGTGNAARTRHRATEHRLMHTHRLPASGPSPERPTEARSTCGTTGRGFDSLDVPPPTGTKQSQAWSSCLRADGRVSAARWGQPGVAGTCRRSSPLPADGQRASSWCIHRHPAAELLDPRRGRSTVPFPLRRAWVP